MAKEKRFRISEKRVLILNKGKKKFLIHNALIVGDWVVLGRIQGGKRFVIFDRIKPIPELKGEWI